MKIAISELHQKILKTLGNNFSDEESAKIANYLIWAEMSGIKTQGILKMTGTEPLQNIKPKHEIKIERDTKLSQLIDAGAYPAPLVSQIATDTVIQKASDHGFAIVGVRNTYSSNGAQAYYVDQIAKKNLIGVMCSRSPSSTAAFDGIDPIFGTNPIGFGFPTKDEPIVFDIATSALTWYGLVLAKTKGEKIPNNVAIDKNGNITIDPEEAMKGALLPFDRSYKGSIISMVVEILAGPLISSAYIDNQTFKEEWGSVFIAIDPELLVDVDEFKANCSEMIERIKSSRKKPGVEKIRLPGERALVARHESEKNGFVDIEEKVLKELGYI